MPVVSIVIPTFNCGHLIATAVESALDQSYENVEIVVIDDGSTDETCSVLAPYIGNGSITYLYQDNTGLPGARNAGICKSSGEYIVMLDADDELDRKMVETCLERVEKEETDWCVCDIERVETYREPYKRNIYKAKVPDNNYLMHMLKDDFISRSVFFRKSSLEDIGMYHNDIRVRVDWEINIRLFRAGKKFSYIQEPLYIYKLRNNSMVKTRDRIKYDNTLKLLKKHHKKLADGGNREAAKIYAHHLWRLGRAYLLESRAPWAFMACLAESVRYDFSIGRILHPLYHHAVKRWV